MQPGGNRLARRVERHKEAVAERLHLAAAVIPDLAADQRLLSGQNLVCGIVAELRPQRGRPHDVCEQNREGSFSKILFGRQALFQPDVRPVRGVQALVPSGPGATIRATPTDHPAPQDGGQQVFRPVSVRAASTTAGGCR
jgi:hypothetical protein